MRPCSWWLGPCPWKEINACRISFKPGFEGHAARSARLFWASRKAFPRQSLSTTSPCTVGSSDAELCKGVDPSPNSARNFESSSSVSLIIFGSERDPLLLGLSMLPCIVAENSRFIIFDSSLSLHSIAEQCSCAWRLCLRQILACTENYHRKDRLDACLFYICWPCVKTCSIVLHRYEKTATKTDLTSAAVPGFFQTEIGHWKSFNDCEPLHRMNISACR